MVFSIIVPCYNASDTIVRALNSVINQTFKDYEIIIVDDGSTDNLEHIICKYFKGKNVNFQYVFQNNKGPSVARNRAVKYSSGKYLAFLDADDEWHNKKLEIQYKVMNESNIKFISTNYTHGSFEEISEITLKKFVFNDFLLSNRTSTPCTVVEKKLFYEAGGFPEEQKYSEDYRLWLSLTQLEPLYSISSPKLVRLHKSAYGEKGLSASLWKMEKGELANYYYCYEKAYINRKTYNIIVIYSFLKYFKRVIHQLFNKFMFLITKKRHY